mmetsp:Transcript_33176/g.50056  ORF Transcript_33176/g.50056 Transcript_33176/m.50056 type:complete len:110 (+) Transcript_33176:86-415(+)
MDKKPTQQLQLQIQLQLQVATTTTEGGEMASTRRPVQRSHGREWYDNNAALRGGSINGPIPTRDWYVEDSVGERYSHSSVEKEKCMSRLDFFLLMFPPDHLLKIISWTN